MTTIITCYCPVKSSSPGSAYSQHLTYMAENSNDIPCDVKCPRQLFGYDLRSLIQSKTDEGHQVIVCGDFNSEYKSLQEWMQSNGCIDLLSTRHGKSPITYQRSASDPLDCIFSHPSIQIKKGGCLSFGRLMGDHRGIWIDKP